jgi:hypothetical protein
MTSRNSLATGWRPDRLAAATRSAACVGRTSVPTAARPSVRASRRLMHPSCMTRQLSREALTRIMRGRAQRAGYSALRVLTGSMRAARRPGRNDANAARTSMTSGTLTNVPASTGVTSKSSADRLRLAANASAHPIALPIAASVRPCLMTRRKTRAAAYDSDVNSRVELPSKGPPPVSRTTLRSSRSATGTPRPRLTSSERASSRPRTTRPQHDDRVHHEQARRQRRRQPHRIPADARQRGE